MKVTISDNVGGHVIDGIRRGDVAKKTSELVRLLLRRERRNIKITVEEP